MMKRSLGLTILLLIAELAFAAGNKLSPDLAKQNPGAKVNVIVQFTHVPSPSDYNNVRAAGGTLHSELSLVKGAVFRLPVAALRGLSQSPAISYISLDRSVQGSLDYSGPALNAGLAWQYGWTGTGIGIAIIDSGINVNYDLKTSDLSSSRVVYSQNFVTNEDGDDKYGHGTHVAGIAAGNGKNSTGSGYTHTFKGIAPNAKLVSLKVLDQNGAGQDSTVISAIQRAVQLKSTYNIRVINLSLGRAVFESYKLDPLCQAAEAAWNAGIVVVAAAGNDGRNNAAGTNGYATIRAPGNDPYVITVGAMKTMGTATRADDLIASYSSKGPTLFDHVVKPDLVAPGNRIISISADSNLYSLYPANQILYSYYKSNNSNASSPDYFKMSGTSMATPMVSGAAALLLQKNPSLTPDQVKARLMKTASKSFPSYSTTIDPVTGAAYTSQYDIFTVGAGYLDVWAALNNSDAAAGTALSPTVNYDSVTGNTSLVLASGVVWGDSLVWGSSLVWGTSVFVNGSSVIWGDSVVWGDSTNLGFSVVWGDSIVWGDSTQTSGESTQIAVQGEN